MTTRLPANVKVHLALGFIDMRMSSGSVPKDRRSIGYGGSRSWTQCPLDRHFNSRCSAIDIASAVT
jgi:hypothetical protein